MSLIKNDDFAIAQKRASIVTSPQDLTDSVQTGRQASAHKWFIAPPPGEKVKERQKVSEVIGGLTPSTDLHVVSDGAWGAHSMLAGVMRDKLHGPGSLYFTSWVISREPMDWLLKMLDDGRLDFCKVLVDARNKTLRSGIVETANLHDKFQAYHTQIHAKVWVLESEKSSITCLSSANFSRNRRIEVYYLTFSDVVARFHKDWIMKRWNYLDALVNQG